MLLIAGFGLGAWGVLNFVWPRRLARQYIVTQDKVAITPQQNGFTATCGAEVFRDASLDGPLSILDDSLLERISNAFSLHPWVAKVVSVSRKPMARMEVKLEYRRPVCMVEAPGEPLPVDVEGRLLPSGDFSPVEKSSYLRLTGIDTVPMGPAGQPWGDGRVVGGAGDCRGVGRCLAGIEVGPDCALAPPAHGGGRRADLSIVHSRRHADFLGSCPREQGAGRASAGGEGRPTAAIQGGS